MDVESSVRLWGWVVSMIQVAVRGGNQKSISDGRIML